MSQSHNRASLAYESVGEPVTAPEAEALRRACTLNMQDPCIPVIDHSGNEVMRVLVSAPSVSEMPVAFVHADQSGVTALLFQMRC